MRLVEWFGFGIIHNAGNQHIAQRWSKILCAIEVRRVTEDSGKIMYAGLILDQWPKAVRSEITDQHTYYFVMVLPPLVAQLPNCQCGNNTPEEIRYMPSFCQ